MTRPISFVDLDDTLFQTYRRQTPDNDFNIASYDKVGKPLGYMNQAQQALWAWLDSTTCVVPVTARDSNSLARVALSFNFGAICCHGAVILDKDGNKDVAYHAHISQALAPLQAQMSAILAQVFDHAKPLGSVRGWTVGDEMAYYLIVKQNSQAPFLAKLLAHLDPALLAGFYWHMNGNNLAIIPNAVSKQNAVRYYLDTLTQKPPLCFGFGDSLSDYAFMRECHFWATPANSQLDGFCGQAIQTAAAKVGGFGVEGQ